jgi:GH15 family glucan-1,4-alpha-glucosidase
MTSYRESSVSTAGHSASLFPTTTGLPAVDKRIRRSPFPPIADYALLSDCNTTCLITSSGSVEWMCLPRPDSPSVFGAILDRAAGHFRLAPYGVSVPSARRYLPGSLILETTWQTHTGWLIVRDALVMGRWHDIDWRSRTHRRTPMDWQAEHILLRTTRCVSGTVELAMSCEPSFDYHRAGAGWDYSGPGYGEAVARARHNADAQPTLRLTTNLRLGIEAREARARTRLSEGDQVFVALGWSNRPLPRSYDEASEKLWSTTQMWRQWSNVGRFPDHRWRSHLRRSALTLKGLTYSPTGALLAASTTSLPEVPQGPFNWDYRYAWVRDAAFAMWDLFALGLDREADDFFAFISDAITADDRDRHLIPPMYAVGGERVPSEQELHHLFGYGGARPVRVGNSAAERRHHNVWGHLLGAVYLHDLFGNRVSDELWPVLTAQIDEVIAHWREPDFGIWEVRGEPQQFVSSKVMCWAAMTRGADIAEKRGNNELARQWRAVADEIRADVLENGVDRRGVLVQRYGSDALDASLVLAVLTRFLPPDDDRARATVLAIADELTDDGFVLRSDGTDDGGGPGKRSFTAGSFLLVSALVEIGEVGRAKRLCERLLSFAGPLNLYAEELDPRTGRHLGNFPYALTHLALINAVLHVIRADSDTDHTGMFAPAHPSA